MSKASSEVEGLYIRTFGCQMNEYDSEKIYALLSSSHRPVEMAEKADLIIVNTCSVREKAESKLYSLLGTYRPLKAENPKLVIGVAGCVAQQEGKRIMSRSNLVDFVVGTHNLSYIPSLVNQVKAENIKQVEIDYRSEWEDLPAEFDALSPSMTNGAYSQGSFGAFYSGVRAMVSIQRGCNKKCSFCVVPTTRGPEVSRSPVEIEREVRAKVLLGAREVMLLGQTVNSYGRDLSPRLKFSEIIRRLAEIPNLERIRFTSPHPAEVREDFIKLYGEVPKLCKQLHMPLQSGSNRILGLMNRNYKVERYLEIIAALKERVPDLSISTDIIVGFPTETEQDFEDTLDVVRKVRFHNSFSFCYSERPNTSAKEVFDQESQVPLAESKSRLQTLQKLQDGLSEEINQSFLGTEARILCEQVNSAERELKGRTEQNIPCRVVASAYGSDKQESFESNEFVGRMLNVKISHASAHGLSAELDR